jgi:hypothetical protein
LILLPLQAMTEQYPHGIGPGGRWLLFAGVPVAIMAALVLATMRNGLIRGVGETALPYVILLVTASIIMVCWSLFHRLPKRWLIPLGLIGWIFAFVSMCWYFWFGPGALYG